MLYPLSYRTLSCPAETRTPSTLVAIYYTEPSGLCIKHPATVLSIGRLRGDLAPTALSRSRGTFGEIRTPDILGRNQTLYPLSYEGWWSRWESNPRPVPSPM